MFIKPMKKNYKKINKYYFLEEIFQKTFQKIFLKDIIRRLFRIIILNKFIK